MKKIIFSLFVVVVCTGFLLCTAPGNPYEDPANAKIVPDKSLLNIKDGLAPDTVYSCSVSVYLINLVDSCRVRISHNGVDSILYYAGVEGLSSVVFQFSPADTGLYAIQIVLVKINGARDSLAAPKQFTVVGRPIPQVAPIVASDTVSIGDSIAVRFHIVARDSNLLGYSTFFNFDPDSTKSHRLDNIYPLTARVGDDTIERKLAGKILLEGLTSPLICYAQAVDRSYGYSEVAVCSVFVLDTIRPKLKLLPPHSELRDSIIHLPDSIVVGAGDLSGIDSITLNGLQMALFNDTGHLVFGKKVIASLDQGINSMTIIAWDKAHNTTTIVMELAYGGPPTYPPKIKSVDKSVREGRGFDTLFLDTCVIITDPAISDGAAYRASLVWIITDSAGNLVPTYNVSTRKLVIPVVSDSEWVDTFSLNFKVVAANGLSDSRVGTFRVYEVPDAPVITLRTEQSKISTLPFDTLFLDTCVRDADNAVSSLTWSFKGGKVFKVDSVFKSRLFKSDAINPGFQYFTRKIVIVPSGFLKLNWTGSDTIHFTASDAGRLSNTKAIVFSKFEIKPLLEDTTSFKPVFPRMSKKRGK